MRDKDVEAARVAISIEPHIARNHYHLGNLLTIAGQLKDAEAAQLNAIELDHSRPEYHTALSRVLHRLGRRADAIEAARKAAEIGQDNALYHRNLGKMFADAGQIDEARRAQQRAVELGCETLGFCNERDDNGFRIFGPSHTINLPILDPKTLTILRIVLAWFGSQWWADEFKRLLLNDDRQSEGELLWPLGKALPAIQNVPIPPPNIKSARPRLSIMIPVYNLEHEAWIRECLNSVLTQDKGVDWAEIIIVDDASTSDKARLIAESFGPRVRYTRNPLNLGIVGNHNYCIAIASGEFVHLLHQDDRIVPGFYDALLEPLSKNDDLVAGFTGVRIINADGTRAEELPLENTHAGILQNWLPRIVQTQRVRFPAMIVRRAAYQTLGGFLPSVNFAFDWEMWCRLAAAGDIWYCPRILTHYRVHEGSMTSRITYLDRMVDQFHALAYTLPLLPDPLRWAVAQQAFNHSLTSGWWQACLADWTPFDTHDRRKLIDFLLSNWMHSDERHRIRSALVGALNLSDS